MNTHDAIELLEENPDVSEFYVLVREVLAYLDVGHEGFRPELKVKVFQSSRTGEAPFHYQVSHVVETPASTGQTVASHPSQMGFESEAQAIEAAVSETVTLFRSAIEEGHEPSEEWMIPNYSY